MPMLMWQDTRGTDRSFEIMARDPNAFMTFVERHGIPPVGGGLSLAHILYVQDDRPEIFARDRRVRRGDGLRHRPPHRQHHREPAQHVHVPTLRQPLARPTGVRRRARAARGRRPDPAAAAGRDRQRDRIIAPGGRAAISACPRPAIVYAGTNDTATAAVATGAFAPGRAGISIGTTSVLVDEVDRVPGRPRPPDLLDARAVPRSLRRVRGERARRQGARARAAQHRLRRSTSSATTAPPIRSPHSTARSRATPAGRGRRDVPAVARRCERAAERQRDARRVREHVARDHAARPDPRRGRGRRAQPARRSSRPVETFTGKPDRRDRARRRRGPFRGVVPGAGRRPRPAGRRARTRRMSPSPGRPRYSRCSAPANGPPPTSTTNPSGDTRRFDPDPAHRSLFADRHEQFEAAYAALLPISEALS